MNEEPTQSSTPDAGQACGCTCEFCTAGNHDQCQSGMCMAKTKPADTQPPQDTPAA